MTSHKQIEKELKRPDGFQAALLRGFRWMGDNPAKVAFMVLPLFLVGMIGYGVSVYMESQAQKRRAALAEIISLSSTEEEAPTKAKEPLQKEIDAIRSASSSKIVDGKPGKPSVDDQKKIDELEKKIADLKPDHTDSSAKFKAFFDQNQEKAEGWMAGLTWAERQLEDGKLADAKAVVETVVKKSTSNKFYQIQSRFILANILDESGDFDGALKEADILLGLVDEEAKPMMLLMKGQILHAKKDDQTAKTILAEIIEKHGSTREAQLARSLLSEMDSAS